jgi:addiction module HigA family antidote
MFCLARWRAPGRRDRRLLLRSEAASIKRDDVDHRKVDLSDIASGRRLPPVHPGKILRDEFLTPMKISVYNVTKVSRTRANDIVLGGRAITIDTAIRLGRCFGTSSEFWINLQTRYDLDVADRSVRRCVSSSTGSWQNRTPPLMN